jgi:hypothetical protein
VTAAEPIGKYQIYTTKAIGSDDLLAWVMTDSGRLVQWGTLGHVDIFYDFGGNKFHGAASKN